jgi:ABC-2 type transport system permease protein
MQTATTSRADRRQTLWAELRFLRGLVALNLSSAMEYRAAFVTQVLGMFLNNGIYFVFWLLFFDRFGEVRGYGLRDVYLLFAVVALAFGLAATFCGNNNARLATIIAQGRLDYYLVLPRHLLLHVLCSHMIPSGVGDAAFGLMAFAFAGRFHPAEVLLYLTASLLAAFIFVGYGVLTGSLAFYFGNATYMSEQTTNALVTFALYPNALFTGMARLVLLTLIPAAFVGAVPVDIVSGRDWRLLGGLALVALLVCGLAVWVFYRGLRRYESGSAINVSL